MSACRVALSRGLGSVIFRNHVNARGVTFCQINRLKWTLEDDNHKTVFLSSPSSSTQVGSCAVRSASTSSGKDDNNIQEKNKRTEVTYEELQQLIKENCVKVFDVREPKELEETGKIPTAVNIPLTKLKGVLVENQTVSSENAVNPPAKDESLIFYGLCNVKSLAALEIAHKTGYKKARHFPGGWREWSARQSSSS